MAERAIFELFHRLFSLHQILLYFSEFTFNRGLQLEKWIPLTVRQGSIYLTSNCGFSDGVKREVKYDSNYAAC